MMAQINVTNLTFCYDGSFDNVFEDVSFSVDTDWKLGFIGRNGKGKTTFLNLLLGKYEYSGNICTQMVFDYFPYQLSEGQKASPAVDFMGDLKAGCEPWRVFCELDKLRLPQEVLYRPFSTLSHGERTRVMLAILFSGENAFLLIDEPTNHLDQEAKDVVKNYLRQKKGFILVSHDRDLLDVCIDHVLVLNRKTIEIQKGNFSSWWENKSRRDNFSRKENEKHLREIGQLRQSARQSDRWAQKNESTKIGRDPIKDHDYKNGSRAYIGAKTKKMQSRVKQYERRMEREIEEKEGLLKDVEEVVDLKITPLSYHKDVLVLARDCTVGYVVPARWKTPGRGAPGAGDLEGDFAPGGERVIPGEPGFEMGEGERTVLRGFNFELRQGERIALRGRNGCGKSSFLKAVLSRMGQDMEAGLFVRGTLAVGTGLKVSYINQDTSFLKGDMKAFCRARGLDESLFCAILRQLDMGREQFVKPMEDYSEGQKKKVLVAVGLMTPAHVYVWDEPLNYIDVFSRMQIENLLLKFQPTMIVVEHDVRFCERIATRIVEVKG